MQCGPVTHGCDSCFSLLPFLPRRPRPRPSPLLRGRAGDGGGRQENPEPGVEAGWGTGGAGPSTFRNVSGMFPVGVGSRAGSGPSPPPPRGGGLALGPGAARARPGGGGGAWAGRRWGPPERVQRGGRGTGAGARGGPGGRLLRAGSPPRAQVQRSSCEVPTLPLEGKGSHRRAAGGEKRVEGNARERLGEVGGGAACPFV